MKVPLIALTLLSLASCASNAANYKVLVEGFADPSATGLSTYVLESNRYTEDMAWPEHSASLERAMESRGWTRVEDPNSADMRVVLAYEMSEPREVEYTYRDPIYGQTGTQTTYESNTVHGDPNSSTETTTPIYGVTGYETKHATRNVYTRRVKVTAYAADPEGGFVSSPAWKVKAKSTGSSSDLRGVVPVMLAAAQPHLGTSTGRTITVSIDEDDRRIRALLAGSTH